jgi:hypothetical protein
VTKDPVRDASFQSPDGFFMGFAFADLAVIEDAAFALVAELGNRGDMDSEVQGPVPSRVQTVTTRAPEEASSGAVPL